MTSQERFRARLSDFDAEVAAAEAARRRANRIRAGFLVSCFAVGILLNFAIHALT